MTMTTSERPHRSWRNPCVEMDTHNLCWMDKRYGYVMSRLKHVLYAVITSIRHYFATKTGM